MSRPPLIKVILMSGYVTETGDPDFASSVGAGFLSRPFTPEQLLRRVAAVVDGVAR